MPFIPDPYLPPVDRRLEMAILIAEHAIRIGEKLLAENAELKRCLEESRANGHRRQRTRQPA